MQRTLGECGADAVYLLSVKPEKSRKDTIDLRRKPFC